MKLENILAQERRARMAAERLLAQKQQELSSANRMLSQHADSLSDEITETLGVVEGIRDENQQVRADLEKANQEMVIARRRLWDSIETIKDGFAVFDRSNQLIAANSAYLQPFDGLSCIKPGIRYTEILDIATDEGIVDIGNMRPLAWRDMMLERWHSTTSDPIIIRLWDGTHIKLIDQRSGDGDMVSLGLNITETINYQAQLKEARYKAEAANRAKSAFLANMSHEIRTPMNGVVSMAELMAEGDLNDEQRLYVDTIRQSGEALLSIINDVLDYSKIEASKMTLHPEPFDLEQVILDVITLLQPSIHNKDVRLSLDFDLFLPRMFIGDVVRIRQILTNLIGNAVKFTSEGYVLIRAVGLPARNPQEQKVHVTVEDSGIGISKDMQQYIFGEFNQIEAQQNREFEGTGLGLTITRQLVELMGGEIWVDSEENAGSCFGFQLTLPVAQPSDLPTPLGHTGSALLAIKDNLDRTILEKRLHEAGLRVELYDQRSTSQDTIANAHLVIADEQFCADIGATTNLPLIKHLREKNETAPIFLITARKTNALEKDHQAALATQTLHPPLNRNTVLNIIGQTTSSQMAAERNTPPQSPEQNLPQQAEPRLMKILAAEDNKTNQLVFSKLVKDLNIELHFANNGVQAVELYSELQPDLIFMDISMPIIDGKEATRRIRALEQQEQLKRTRIVALTAHALTGDDQEIISHGLDEHMTKPLKKAEIIYEILSSCPEQAYCPLSEQCD